MCLRFDFDRSGSIHGNSSIDSEESDEKQLTKRDVWMDAPFARTVLPPPCDFAK